MPLPKTPILCPSLPSLHPIARCAPCGLPPSAAVTGHIPTPCRPLLSAGSSRNFAISLTVLPPPASIPCCCRAASAPQPFFLRIWNRGTAARRASPVSRPAMTLWPSPLRSATSVECRFTPGWWPYLSAGGTGWDAATCGVTFQNCSNVLVTRGL